MRRARTGRLLIVGATIPWLLSLACVVYTPVATRPPTLGEELLSLDQARRDGLLTQAEYEQRRAQTIAVWKQIGRTPVQASNGPSLPPPPETPVEPKGTK